MDEIEKALQKLSSKERERFKSMIANILAGNVSGLDVLKLKGHKRVYRARVGKRRIVFVKRPDGGFTVIKFSVRNDTTYDI